MQLLIDGDELTTMATKQPKIAQQSNQPTQQPARTSKGRTVHPQEDIDKAVKRYLNGEAATVLMNQYRVSKAGFYLWVRNFKARAEKQAAIAANPSADKQALQAENQELKAQVRELRERLMARMIKLGEL